MEPAAMQRRRRHSQVVRQGTANPRFSGSNPDGASIKGPERKLRAFSFWSPLPCRANGARAYPRYPFTHAGRAWKPSPTSRGKVDASNRRRRSSGGRGVEDAAPYGGCVTNAAAYDVTVRFLPASQMVRGLCPRNINRWSVNTRLTHRGKHEQNRSGQTATANPTPRSRNHGAPRTVHPTGDS